MAVHCKQQIKFDKYDNDVVKDHVISNMFCETIEIWFIALGYFSVT